MKPVQNSAGSFSQSPNRHCWNRRIGTGVRRRGRISDSKPGADGGRVNEAMRQIEAEEKTMPTIPGLAF